MLCGDIEKERFINENVLFFWKLRIETSDYVLFAVILSMCKCEAPTAPVFWRYSSTYETDLVGFLEADIVCVRQHRKNHKVMTRWLLIVQ